MNDHFFRFPFGFWIMVDSLWIFNMNKCSKITLRILNKWTKMSIIYDFIKFWLQMRFGVMWCVLLTSFHFRWRERSHSNGLCASVLLVCAFAPVQSINFRIQPKTFPIKEVFTNVEKSNPASEPVPLWTCVLPRKAVIHTHFQNIPQQQWNKSKFIFWVN